MIDLRSLMVRKGQAFTLRLWHLLLQAIEERTVKKGRGVVLGHSPDGVTVHASARGGRSSVEWPWMMDVSLKDDVLELTFPKQGYVGGVPAMIGDREMAKEDDSGNLPVLELKVADIKNRLAFVYVKVTVDRVRWRPMLVELVAATEVPAREPWVAWKLISLLVQDEGGAVTDDARVFFDLDVAAASRRANGFFLPIWTAK